MASTVIEFQIDGLRLPNPLNGSMGMTQRGRFARARQAKERRAIALAFTRSALLGAIATNGGQFPIAMPATIMLTRLSAGVVDAHDALPASCKQVVDGICDALGMKDNDGRLRFAYAQEKTKRGVYGLRVRIEGADVARKETA